MYLSFLRDNLNARLRKCRTDLKSNGVIILHDNARPHKGVSVVQFFENNGWEILPHPPYSPDMSPPDFDLFPKWKEELRGVRFTDLESLQQRAFQQIKRLNKSGVLNGIQSLPKRWQQVIDMQGDYIEGA